MNLVANRMWWILWSRWPPSAAQTMRRRERRQRRRPPKSRTAAAATRRRRRRRRRWAVGGGVWEGATPRAAAVLPSLGESCPPSMPFPTPAHPPTHPSTTPTFPPTLPSTTPTRPQAAAPEVPVKPGSHSDAVLGLAWNAAFRNVLASASGGCWCRGLLLLPPGVAEARGVYARRTEPTRAVPTLYIFLCLILIALFPTPCACTSRGGQDCQGVGRGHPGLPAKPPSLPFSSSHVCLALASPLQLMALQRTRRSRCGT